MCKHFSPGNQTKQGYGFESVTLGLKEREQWGISACPLPQTVNSLNLLHADTNTWSSLFSQPAAEGTGVLQRNVRDAACGEAKL